MSLNENEIKTLQAEQNAANIKIKNYQNSFAKDLLYGNIGKEIENAKKPKKITLYKKIINKIKSWLH